MKQVKHWQDPLNAVLGACLVLSPWSWSLGYTDLQVATFNAVIIGAALIATALGAMLFPKAWEEWAEAVLGLWMLASPWVLGFAGHRPAMLVAVIVGAAVMLLALWTLATDKDYSLSKSMMP
ncbi:MAG: SPW repeat protein [Burkholderiaceae bacterium]